MKMASGHPNHRRGQSVDERPTRVMANHEAGRRSRADDEKLSAIRLGCLMNSGLNGTTRNTACQGEREKDEKKSETAKARRAAHCCGVAEAQRGGDYLAIGLDR